MEGWTNDQTWNMNVSLDDRFHHDLVRLALRTSSIPELADKLRRLSGSRAKDVNWLEIAESWHQRLRDYGI